MSGTVETLTNYWAEVYASEFEGAAEPIIAVVGHASDMIASADKFGDNPIDNLAFMAGFLTYPCDATYITCIQPVYGLPSEDGTVPEEVAEIDMHLAIVAWTHAIPTREFATAMHVRHLLDDGTSTWEHVNLTGQETLFDPVVAAMHDYDRFEPHPNDERLRKFALDTVVRDNGNGYEVTALPAGTIIAHAEHHEEHHT